ncbi:MAG: cupredoxin domain-containing protein [Ktedonobacteraceae bacterium]
MKKILLFVCILGICSFALVACGTGAGASGTTGTTTGSSTSGTVVTVKAGLTNFLQSSVTLNKGDTLQIVNTASDIHIISLGSWVNGGPVPATEPGAPKVLNEQLPANGTLTIGQFNTAGTYHLYCTIHIGMNLTVVVK